ncbi:unnamed protein product [Timema podura]|uniref:Uncharacterized protein n=1 Tax=Timema podura TaxID=61482 RepID=A0ABN7PFZ8_TIMPD|nr:unnamed protein product [Timema podura]
MLVIIFRVLMSAIATLSFSITRATKRSRD